MGCPRFPGVERLHGEIKRCIKSVGALPDRANALRLITAVAMHATSASRRYLDMSLLDDLELNPEPQELRQAA